MHLTISGRRLKTFACLSPTSATSAEPRVSRTSPITWTIGQKTQLIPPCRSISAESTKCDFNSLCDNSRRNGPKIRVASGGHGLPSKDGWVAQIVRAGAVCVCVCRCTHRRSDSACLDRLPSAQWVADHGKAVKPFCPMTNL